MNTQLAKVDTFIKDIQPKLAQRNGEHLNAMRLMTIFQGEIERVPQIANCSPRSMSIALMRCMEFQLEPGPLSHVALIPRGRDLQWQLQYQGIEALIMRTGLVEYMVASCYTQDEVDRGALRITRFPPTVEHDWSNIEYDEINVAGAYFAAVLKSGKMWFETTTRSEIDKRRAAAQTDKVWARWFEAMASKCPIRKAMSRGRMPIDQKSASVIAAALSADEATPERPEVVTRRLSNMDGPPASRVISGIVVDDPGFSGLRPAPPEMGYDTPPNPLTHSFPTRKAPPAPPAPPAAPEVPEPMADDEALRLATSNIIGRINELAGTRAKRTASSNLELVRGLANFTEAAILETIEFFAPDCDKDDLTPMNLLTRETFEQLHSEMVERKAQPPQNPPQSDDPPPPDGEQGEAAKAVSEACAGLGVEWAMVNDVARSLDLSTDPRTWSMDQATAIINALEVKLGA